jgi:hypothetical protein
MVTLMKHKGQEEHGELVVAQPVPFPMGRPVAIDVLGNRHLLQPGNENRDSIDPLDLRTAHGLAPVLDDSRRLYHRRSARQSAAAENTKQYSALSKGQRVCFCVYGQAFPRVRGLCLRSTRYGAVF